MIVKNTIEKSFGTGGSWTGIFMFIAGIMVSYFSLWGLILVIPGAFIGFTYEGTILDLENKRIKCVNYLFGIIAIGTWIVIEPGMMLGLKRKHTGQSTMTRGHVLEVHKVDFRIELYSLKNNQIMTISTFDNIEAASINIEKLSSQLSLSILE